MEMLTKNYLVGESMYDQFDGGDIQVWSHNILVNASHLIVAKKNGQNKITLRALPCGLIEYFVDDKEPIKLISIDQIIKALAPLKCQRVNRKKRLK